MTNIYVNPFAGSCGGISSFIMPTQQVFNSGSGTYTPPSSPRAPIYLRVQMCGGGGGGEGSSAGVDGGDGGDGGTSTFGALTAHGGTGATFTEAGIGGTCVTGVGYGTAFKGQNGSVNAGNIFGASLVAGFQIENFLCGGVGGDSLFPGGGQSWHEIDAVPNTGSGGGGASILANSGVSTIYNSGMGGGGGGYLNFIVPVNTYSYGVGAAGTAGAAGTLGTIGGLGAAGKIIVTEYYQ